MKTPFYLGLIIAVCLATASASAQSVPALINYQGQLTQPNGQPLPTADYELSFSIYDAARAGNLVWGPQVFNGQSGPGYGPKIPVVQGYFNVMLGPKDTESRSITDAFNGTNCFFEVTVAGNSPIAPRQQILSAPFAFRSAYAQESGNAQTLGSKSAGDFVARSGDTMTGVLSLPSSGLSIDGHRALFSGWYGLDALGVNLDAPYTILGGNVGIGNFQGSFPPAAPLHLSRPNPRLVIQHQDAVAGGASLAMLASGGSENKVTIQMHSVTLESASGGGGEYLKITNNAGLLTYFAPNGFVGIGTTSPQTKLDVSGTIKATALQLGPRETGTNVGLGGFAISGSSGKWSTGVVGSLTWVPPLSVSLATSGRPVMVTLIPPLASGSPDEGAQVGLWRAGDGRVTGNFVLRRDHAVMGIQRLERSGAATGDYMVPGSSIQFIDFPPANSSVTYTFNVELRDGGRVYVYDCRLVAFEL